MKSHRSRIWHAVTIILLTGIVFGCESDTSETLSETTVARSRATRPLVADGAVPVELCTVDAFAGERSKSEGPVADSAGNVYFSDPYGSKIFRWSQTDGLTVYQEQVNGPNGLDIDRRGNLVACAGFDRRIVSLAPDGAMTVLTDRFEGKKYNEPNDLFIDNKGGIYFSDPYFHVHYDPLEQDNTNVFYLTPDRNDVFPVIGDLTNPNGICASPDGSLLYVIETGTEQTFAYDVNPDGTLSGKRLFVPWGVDGLTVDSGGNVYITGTEDHVNIYNPAGERIGQIFVPITKGHTSNVCFGVKDPHTLYITAGNSLFSIEMTVRGVQ